ncbi:S1-like domain-containing RNA-binding protein [Gillisia sp. M10.2A]|uniref:S1-like domain-containing RNA-binding protein n=1 Tax=Gillisia lutea TaxID=2909668 RepID=A0ABS9EID3_9FLAO|nr:S1-like domain-containing RNA-binding protein [Gillisia lutea]MCF4102619.1 S1-like domain-containing RNA-binding protein [Gillisia lutea]
MLNLGEYHTLIIDRDTEPGLFLRNEEGDEVLLPNKYVPANFQLEDEIEVFIYLDHSERPVATTLKPYVKLDEFAYLKCVEVSEYGAFLDWGLEKHLFVPFKEMATKMRKNSWYLIFCYLDEATNRLVGSSKTNAFLDNTELTVAPFEEVDLIVANPTDLGVNVIVNELHQGLIFKDDIFQDMQPGDRLKGWIKKTRPDGKLDITLQRPGYRSIEPNAQDILNEISLKGGCLKLTDKSSPEEIQRVLQMSKKSFKKAVGTLYKQRLIEIKEDGIYLQKEN